MFSIGNEKQFHLPHTDQYLIEGSRLNLLPPHLGHLGRIRLPIIVNGLFPCSAGKLIE